MSETIKREIFSWMKTFVIALFIAFIFRTFLFSPATVYGESMFPTFEDQDKVLISKISDIERFDLIIFDAPDADKKYIKRVIGLPGDQIEVKDDVLYINGKEMKEPYLEENKEETVFGKLTGDFTLEEITGKERVPKGALFVMGDNRLHSKDSRYFGFVSEDALLGEVTFRFYPLEEWGLPK